MKRASESVNGPGQCSRLGLAFGFLCLLAAPEATAQDTNQASDGDTGRDIAAPIVVASKPFAESYILAEAFSQLLERNGFAVDRRPGLAATEVAFQALRAGSIDVYPEYTGTALTAVLNDSPEGTSAQVFTRVSQAFEERWGIRWLAPLGFENTYAVAVRQETADSLDIRTISELAATGASLTAGLSPDFIGRPDGLPGITAAYGLRFADVRPLLQAVKYQALAESEVDIIDGYSTDGSIARYDLRVLADDRGFFPPYDAAAVVGARLYTTRPDAVLVLGRLSGRIDVTAMRRANERVELDGVSVPDAAAGLLADVGLGDERINAEPVGLQADQSIRSLPRYLWANRSDLSRQTQRHLFLVLLSLAAAILVAVPAGLALERTRGLAEPVIRFVGVLQTVPGIALLAFMIPFFGIGVVPAVAALFLYSLLPILRNTYTGIIEADRGAVSAGQALGMTATQVLTQIRLPLAVPTIMAGIRTAAVINVGTATLAAFIGAGGLGDPIVAGLALSDPLMILSGAVPAAVLALLVDLGLAAAETRARPRGTA